MLSVLLAPPERVFAALGLLFPPLNFGLTAHERHVLNMAAEELIVEQLPLAARFSPCLNAAMVAMQRFSDEWSVDDRGEIELFVPISWGIYSVLSRIVPVTSRDKNKMALLEACEMLRGACDQYAYDKKRRPAYLWEDIERAYAALIKTGPLFFIQQMPCGIDASISLPPSGSPASLSLVGSLPSVMEAPAS